MSQTSLYFIFKRRLTCALEKTAQMYATDLSTKDNLCIHSKNCRNSEIYILRCIEIVNCAV